MNKSPTLGKTSRRQFVRLAGGLALALRHGLLSAQTGTGAPRMAKPVGRAAATLEDPALRIEWDANLYAQVSLRAGQRWIAMTNWRPSEYLLRDDGRHVTDFPIRHQAQSTVDDVNGPGARLTLSGTSVDGIEKTVTVTTYQRHPGIALVRVSYRNTGTEILSISSWTNGDAQVLAAGARAPAFWCYSGATYEDRRDWVQPVGPGFAQDNFLGMEASDYGGGTPIVDVWQPRRRARGGSCGNHAEARLASGTGSAWRRARGCVRPREALPQARRTVRNAGDLRRRASRRLFRRAEQLSTPHVRTRPDPGGGAGGVLRTDLVCLGLRARLHHGVDRGNTAQGEGVGIGMGGHR